MYIIIFCMLALLVAGVTEFRKHNKNVAAIPVRVNVNGVRGKSTVTRLVTGVLNEARYKTVGKTTGTQARMLYWFEDREEPIERRPEGPNIGEQKGVVKKAASMHAEALVSECMAVTPDYQKVFQKDMLQANIGVIVNVLEDHMDVLGPTMDEVAQSFTATIPNDGYLIVNENPYVPMFRAIAEKRNTAVIVADTSRISEAFLRKFPYMVFPENAALALAVAEALGIDEHTAFKGMLQAWPDPGSLEITPINSFQGPSSYLVNGFAANDAASTINIWKRVKRLGYPTDESVVVMNCRSDRVDRTEQFATDVLPYIPCKTLVLIGETTSPIVDGYDDGNIPADTLLNFEKYPTKDIIQEIQPYIRQALIYGVGNFHGAAEAFVDEIQQIQITEEEPFVNEVAAHQ
ncbi:poly-gamma-glutamate synthase PgsB [Salicibibacter halophilus]|uniref:poly-gamma-glutamate synthase PgsB n=1 Tax=Salicibibacter halophilus TaxID=2502791 RepID=UPI001D037176|nr:poly-gamma-glutamate synthase PgsB [Salicibibacter halophilus]